MEHDHVGVLSRRTLGAAALGLSALALVPRGSRADGARTWRKLPIEPYPGKQDDVAFVDGGVGWYGTGKGLLYATRDGGLSWRQIWSSPGTFIRALGFLDASTGFLGNVGVGYYPGVTDTHPLYRTGDGGRTWTPVSAPGLEAVAGICAIDVLSTVRVYQGEARRVSVVHAAGRVGGPAALVSSSDGGATWTVQDLSSVAGMVLDVKFLDERTGFLCAATSSDAEKGEALILRTRDGGRRWEPVYRSGRALENCWKMSWPSERVGYATVQSYDPAPTNVRRVVVKTEDGGATWQELPLVSRAGVQEFGVGFVDESRGWVGCKDGGFETRDGGRSWEPVAFGRAVNKIRIVQDGARKRVFAIGVDLHRLDL